MTDLNTTPRLRDAAADAKTAAAALPREVEALQAALVASLADLALVHGGDTVVKEAEESFGDHVAALVDDALIDAGWSREDGCLVHPDAEPGSYLAERHAAGRVAA